MSKNKSIIELNSGCETNSISLPGYLWEMLDAAKEKQDRSKSAIIKRSLLKTFSQEKVNDCQMLEKLYHEMVIKPKQ